MSKIKIANKGYTITVVSWENDGDYYQTNSITVDTIEKAKIWYDLITFIQENEFSNETEMTEESENIIIEYMDKFDVSLIDEELERYKSDKIYVFNNLQKRLLGYSEYYWCRVIDKYTITYLEEDIYAEEINFE